MMIMDNGGHNDMNDGAWGLPGSGGGQLAMQMWSLGNNFDDHVYQGWCNHENNNEDDNKDNALQLNF